MLTVRQEEIAAGVGLGTLPCIEVTGKTTQHFSMLALNIFPQSQRLSIPNITYVLCLMTVVGIKIDLLHEFRDMVARNFSKPRCTTSLQVLTESYCINFFLYSLKCVLHAQAFI